MPTVREVGIDAEYVNWIGLAVPKKTPREIVERLEDMMVKVMKDKSYVNTLETTGDEPHFMDGPTLAKHWDAESDRIGKLMVELVKDAAKK